MDHTSYKWRPSTSSPFDFRRTRQGTPPGEAAVPVKEASPLAEIADFGSNPGNLRMFIRLPSLSQGVSTSLRAHSGAVAGAHGLSGEPGQSRPLVVALHGCLQTPAAYDQGSGWSQLAERCGFALLMPGQRPANNPNRCFNWFAPEHSRRDAGECRSIEQMIDYTITGHGIDPSRVFVVGLSAGAAMAVNMLANYPEVFAGGASIAGLPFGTAASLPQALESMAQGRTMPPSQWGALVRAASSHSGTWPRMSVWHGAADTIVHPGNAESLVGQWRAVHGHAGQPEEEQVGRHRRRIWRGSDGRELIESYEVAGMAHGVPLVVADGRASLGSIGGFHLDAGICSTERIARFWGLMEQVEAWREAAPTVPSP